MWKEELCRRYLNKQYLYFVHHKNFSEKSHRDQRKINDVR